MNTPAQHPSPPLHHTPATAGRCAVPLTLLLLLALCAPSPHAAAQRPCNDTTVLILDSICEGDTLYYRGRTLDHSGIYYDTIPRTDTICDSIIILKLTLLDIPYINIIDRKHCKTIIGPLDRRPARQHPRRPRMEKLGTRQSPHPHHLHTAARLSCLTSTMPRHQLHLHHPH